MHYKTFAELLKAIRNETGLTQAHFAEKIEVSAVLIAMLETGQKHPTKKFIEKLAHKMRVSPQSLLPFIVDSRECDACELSPVERRLIELGSKLQEELIKKKSKNILDE